MGKLSQIRAETEQREAEIMKYNKIIKGNFISRLNRFEAMVRIDGKDELVHVKNTGRCKELLVPEATVFLSVSDNPKRKTRCDLVAVYKGDRLINMDSQAPNHVVHEWLLSDKCSIGKVTAIKPEYTYGKSRLDFYFEREGHKCLLEVKGVTLEREGVAYFPDAPTTRGVKHVKELAGATKEGYECYIAFVVQMEGVSEVYPNLDTHPEFGQALSTAMEAGVKKLVLECQVKPDELTIIS
jgi:sugar fermentation stimulation protein A